MTADLLLGAVNTNRTCDIICALRNDPTFMKLIERGMTARNEGRVKPWSKVKEELGIR